MSESVTSQPIEALIGQTLEINPQQLLNRKRLYSTQNSIDPTKLRAVAINLPDPLKETIDAWVSAEKRGITYTLGNGNHRVGIACIYGTTVEIKIVGKWDPNQRKRYGFNTIVHLIRDRLGIGT